MYPTTIARTRSTSTTYTRSRAEAVLAVFLGDVAAFLSRGLLTRHQALDWHRDLLDALDMEAVASFQLKFTLPDGTLRALDYEVSDDGCISAADECGGFAALWIPDGTRVTLVLSLRDAAPRSGETREMLRSRGWGVGSKIAATGAPDRSYSKDGYGLFRRIVGEWQE